MITKEEFKRRSIEVISNDNFGVTVNDNYTVNDAIADDVNWRNYKVAPQHVTAKFDELKEMLKPVANFFSSVQPIPEPVKKMTKKQIQKLETKTRLEIIKQKYLAEIIEDEKG